MTADEQFFTPAEVARILKVSKKTVVRRFAGLPGVINLGHEETLHKKPYRLLRISRTALNRFLAENSGRAA